MITDHRAGFRSISVITPLFFDFRPGARCARAVRVLVSVIVTFCLFFVHALSNSFMSESALAL